MAYANSDTGLADYVRQSAIDVGVYPGQEIPPEHYNKFNNDNTFTITRDMLSSFVVELMKDGMGYSKEVAKRVNIYTKVGFATFDIITNKQVGWVLTQQQ